MPEIPIKARRRILLFADKLATMAADEPIDETTKKEIWGVVQSIRKRLGFTKQQKQIEIWKALQLGAHTISDIIAVTKFNKDDIHDILRGFEAEKLVEFKKINLTGGPGRQSIIISILVESANFAPLKLNSAK